MFTSDTFKQGSTVSLYLRDDIQVRDVTLLSIDSYGITVQNSKGVATFYTFNYVDMMKLVEAAK